MVKFWLHVSAEEQLKRFKERETNPLKSWKLTDDDWRNREKRAAVPARRSRTCSSGPTTSRAGGSSWRATPSATRA